MAAFIGATFLFRMHLLQLPPISGIFPPDEPASRNHIIDWKMLL